MSLGVQQELDVFRISVMPANFRIRNYVVLVLRLPWKFRTAGVFMVLIAGYERLDVETVWFAVKWRWCKVLKNPVNSLKRWHIDEMLGIWTWFKRVSLKETLLWSSGQSSWLQIQRSEFGSKQYHIFWEVACLELAPLSLVSTTEELLGRKVTAPV
jgi:hypothetical protein